jgi:alpha-1,2-mannosyltransferase
VEAGQRSTPRGALAGAFVLAVAVRVGPSLFHHSLRGVFGLDDGVYLSASMRLLSGVVPYRDFTFVQPPGGPLVLTPFAALTRVASEPTVLAALRVAMGLLGGVNALLCAMCAGRYGRRAGLVAALAYAVWPVAAVTESSFELEPVISLGLLVAVLALGSRAARGATVAGVALGLAFTVKVWVAPEALIVAVWLAGRRGLRQALRFTTAAVAAALVVFAPFLALAPAATVRMVVADQLGRPAVGPGAGDRLAFLVGQTYQGTTLHGLVYLVAAVFVLLVTWAAWSRPPAGSLSAGGGGWPEPSPRLWWWLLVVSGAEIVAAPSFYFHYPDFCLPACAVLAGVAVQALTQHSRLLARTTAVATAVVLVAFAAVSAHRLPGTGVHQARLVAFFRAHPCAYASPDVALVGAGEQREIDRHCPAPDDPDGRYLDTVHRYPSPHPSLGPAGSPATGRVIDAGLLASDGAVLTGEPAAQDWPVATQQLFRRRFHQVGTDTLLTLWVPTP